MKKSMWYCCVALALASFPLRGEESFTLQLTHQEKEAISEILSEMSEKNVVYLFLNQLHMNELGDSIRHVPPLQFLGFILTERYLRSCLKNMRNQRLKWSYFIDGFGKNMEKELATGRLFRDLPGFATLIERDYQQLLRLAYARAWDDFVRAAL